MPPTIILIRHAQALHNVHGDSSLRDPVLTALGHEQCTKLEHGLKSAISTGLVDEIELVLVSPMRRTIETAIRGLAWVLEKGVAISAHAGWQENSDFPCDTGTDVRTIEREFPQVDFSQLDPIWPDKTSATAAASRYGYKRDAIIARRESCLEDLYLRPEKVIAVVSHSGFLRQGVTGRWFENADFRIFDLDKESLADGEAYRLSEWHHTDSGGLGLSWTDRISVGEGLPT